LHVNPPAILIGISKLPSLETILSHLMTSNNKINHPSNFWMDFISIRSEVLGFWERFKNHCFSQDVNTKLNGVSGVNT